jgi:hypothetical protein
VYSDQETQLIGKTVVVKLGKRNVKQWRAELMENEKAWRKERNDGGT